jgi:primosomal protein N' (replication factor Y)
MFYAQIAVHRSTVQVFTYHVPDDFTMPLELGHMVRVPFRTAQEVGIVIGLTSEKPPFTTKPVLELLDPRPVLTPAQLHLAEWLAEQTLTPVGQCLWLMLPPGFSPRGGYIYRLLDENALGRDTAERRIISLLYSRGALNTDQMTTAYGNAGWHKAMDKLVIRSMVGKEPTLLPPRVKPKIIRLVRLAIPAEHIPDIALRLGKETKPASILQLLHIVRKMPLADLREETDCTTAQVKGLVEKGWLTIHPDQVVELLLDYDAVYQQIIHQRGGDVYLRILHALADAGGTLTPTEIYARTKATARHLERLSDDGWITLGESEIWRNSLADKSLEPTSPPPLTDAQVETWGRIHAYMEAIHLGNPTTEPGVFLLHGVTSSGKTEVYMHAVDLVLRQGRQAIVMVPEIALTAQMVQRFAARFPGEVALIHSTLSQGERYDTWRRARDGQVKVVIGPRSALFAPLPDVGLIVLDEEHDDSYKQSPPIATPFYHTRAAAIQYMRMNRGTVILGSATPDVVTYFQAQQGNYTYLHLPDRVLAHQATIAQQVSQYHITPDQVESIAGTEVAGLPLPAVEIVDMRQELRVGNTSVFSRRLKDALTAVLQKKQQALLFLNRRGTSTYVFCRDCGYIAACPHCDTPLTYHHPDDLLTCHHCGHREANPTQCPKCQSRRIKYFGRGTEQLEKTLRQEFPQARVLRWDQDTASNHEAHASILQAFVEQRADILVGTQMITKGLDLPMITLVGIVSADTGLGLPDYRANETTFQLLTQVAGRAGRSILGGQVILQTYHPDHYAIQAAAQHDYEAFYAQEIQYRRQMRWMPFSRLARILFRHPIPAKAEEEASRVADLLRKRIKDERFTASELIGPVPCFFAKENNFYRWHILVRSSDPVRLLQGMDIGQDAVLDIDPLDIL